MKTIDKIKFSINRHFKIFGYSVLIGLVIGVAIIIITETKIKTQPKVAEQQIAYEETPLVVTEEK